MLGPTSAILIPCQSRDFVMLELANIVRFSVVYGEFQSVLVVHVGETIVQDITNLVSPKQ